MIKTLVVSIIILFMAIVAKAENRVAVIDTGLDIESEYYKPFLCKTGHKDLTGTGIKDEEGHGTEIVNLIIKNSESTNFCLVIYKFFSRKKRTESSDFLMQALLLIAKEKITLVNLSLSGSGYLKEEDEYFASNRFITFIAAAGNDGVNLDFQPRYPASYDYPNIVVVGALDKYTSQKIPISNYGRRVQHWEKAEATSYATAIKTGKVIKERFGRTDGLF